MLSYSLAGEGDLVILIHGFLGSRRNLSGLAHSLVDHYRVCSIDLPNHGESPVSDDMRFGSIAKMLKELLDHLKADEPIRLMGHSLGGKVAMEFALAFPNAVSHLLIEDIAPVAYPPHHREILDGMLEIDLEGLQSRGDADSQLENAIDDSRTRQFVLMNLRKEGGRFHWKADIQRLSDHYPEIMKGLSLGDRQHYSGKVMFIAGGKSSYITAEMGEKILALFPEAQFRQIGGAGHWVHAEKPEVFNSLAKRFFTS